MFSFTSQTLVTERIERARLEKLLEDKEKLICRLEKTLALVTDQQSVAIK